MYICVSHQHVCACVCAAAQVHCVWVDVCVCVGGGGKDSVRDRKSLWAQTASRSRSQGCLHSKDFPLPFSLFFFITAIVSVPVFLFFQIMYYASVEKFQHCAERNYFMQKPDISAETSQSINEGFYIHKNTVAILNCWICLELWSQFSLRAINYDSPE